MIAALTLGYFVVFVTRTVTRTDIGTLATGPANGAILLAALGSAVTVTLTAVAWHQLLRPWCVTASVRDLAVILGQSQMAKYLPGNFGHHLARSALTLRAGVPVHAVAATMAMEALWTAAVAVSLGSLGLGLSGHPPALLLAGAAGVITLGVVAVRQRAPAGVYGLNFLVLGLALFLVARALAQPSLMSLPAFVGSFAIAWVAGFVVPGAPAGLGVREGLLVALLTPSLGLATMPTILGFRIATTLGDLISFVAASVLRNRQLVGSDSVSEV
ncbi:MAG: hypothetical protein M3Q93_06655 [Gemmatimonadota bacterium]|nr:hypothetical protein [Gemmatimonadota bacterium]